MLLERGAFEGGGIRIDDGIFGGELGVQGVVVDDGITEVEDGGFRDDAVGVIGVVSGEVGVFKVGGWCISGRAHDC